MFCSVSRNWFANHELSNSSIVCHYLFLNHGGIKNATHYKRLQHFGHYMLAYFGKEFIPRSACTREEIMNISLELHLKLNWTIVPTEQRRCLLFSVIVPICQTLSTRKKLHSKYFKYLSLLKKPICYSYTYIVCQ